MSNPENEVPNPKLMKAFTDTMIRLGVIALLVVMCVQVFAPFAGFMAWALILAIALYPVHLKLAGILGGKQGLTATIIVLSGLLLVGGPTIMVGESFARYLNESYVKYQAGDLSIPAPDKSVEEWPLVGKRIYAGWSLAHDNFADYIESSGPQLAEISKKILSVGASTVGGVLAFLASLIIAGVMMVYGRSGKIALGKIYIRFAGPVTGPRLQHLSVATVRSVATGVIGVAFVQALLIGVGLIWAGIPGAPVLALVVLVLGIGQLPATLVTLPAIIYLWVGGDASTTSNVIFTVYLIVAGLVDNVLKPLLLGRGVDVPMPIILFGALGGMVANGIIGLFLGAIILGVGYHIFMDWVAVSPENEEAESSAQGIIESEKAPGQ